MTHRCHHCRAHRDGAPIRVLLADRAHQDRHLCDRCWLLLAAGFTEPVARDALAAYRDGGGLHLTCEELDELLYRGIVLVERQHVRQWLDGAVHLADGGSTPIGEPG